MSAASAAAQTMDQQAHGDAVSPPHRTTADCEGQSLVRSKRSTAGKIRQSRFLDDDVPVAGCQRTQSPNASAGLKRKGHVVLRDPLPLFPGADSHDGMWVGNCIGRWKGNKVYGGALIARQQYVAVGSDVLLKAEPGQEPVSDTSRHAARELCIKRPVVCAWAADGLACGASTVRCADNKNVREQGRWHEDGDVQVVLSQN